MVPNLKAAKILFICSGNKSQGISPIVYNQGESLRNLGMNVEYFPIRGKGIRRYAAHYFPLRKKIRKGNYFALHAHYSYCGMLTALAAPAHRNIIVSLMGSFYKGTIKYYLIHFFSRYLWKAVIVKSENMKNQIRLQQANLIPNGVQTDVFENLPDREIVRERLGFEPDKKYVIFVSDPERPEKNYSLCQQAVAILNDPQVVLYPVFNIQPEEIPPYQLAADVLMLTSFHEGSPNVIKEGLAAGCPIVTTDVGDAHYNIGDTSGCYVMKGFEAEAAADCLRKALDFGGRTNGPDRVLELGIDADTVGRKIINLYHG